MEKIEIDNDCIASEGNETFDWTKESAVIIDVYNSPLHDLPFEDVLTYRLDELFENPEPLKSKIPLYADGKLRQAIAIVHNQHSGRFTEYKIRYALIEHGDRIITLDKLKVDLEKANRIYNTIIHSENDDKARDASTPGKCTLSQCIDARERPAIQIYVEPSVHSKINGIATRFRISMSDYVVICLWESILTSDAPLPNRLIEHGKNLLDEFRSKVNKRLKELERLSSDL